MWDRIPTSTSRPPGRRLWLVALALALLPYLNSIGGDFTFDDLGVIRNNPRVMGPRSSAMELITTAHTVGVLYRPLTMLTYLANARVDEGPKGFHIVNVALHGGVTLAVLHVAWLLLDSAPGAMLAAALFAVHPVHTEAVANIVGRAEELAALLVLLSLLAFARGVRDSSARPIAWRALSVALFALAVLAKESAFSAVALLPLVYLRAAPHRTLRQLGWLVLPYLAVNLGYLGVRRIVIGALTLPVLSAFVDNPLGHVSTAARLRTAAVVLWRYLAVLVAPVRLSPDYSYNQIPVVESWHDPRFVFAASLLASLVVGVIVVSRHHPSIGIAAVVMAVPMALTANVFFPIGTIQAERLLYLPSLGWFLGCAWLLVAWTAPARRSRGPVIVAAVIVALYAGRTWARNPDWHDNCSLFRAAERVAPNSVKVHFNLGVCAELHGENLVQAAIEYRTVLRIYPEHDPAMYAIGHLEERGQRFRRAFYWYERALGVDWNSAKPHVKLGSLHYRLGNYTTAEAAFLAAIEADPECVPALIGLGMARVARGDRFHADLPLRRAGLLIDIQPQFGDQLTGARQAYQISGLLGPAPSAAVSTLPPDRNQL